MPGRTSNGIRFASSIEVPVTVLTGVTGDHADYVLEMVVLVKAWDLAGRLTGPDTDIRRAALAWLIAAVATLKRFCDHALDLHRNVAVALGMCLYRACSLLEYDMPAQFEPFESEIISALRVDAERSDDANSTNSSTDFAFPPATACYHCKTGGFICVVSGSRGACMRCHEHRAGRSCYYENVRKPERRIPL